MVPVHPKHGIAETARSLGVPQEPFAQRLVDLRAQLGTPWQADHRIATDAKWENVQYYCDRMRKTFGG